MFVREPFVNGTTAQHSTAQHSSNRTSDNQQRRQCGVVAGALNVPSRQVRVGSKPKGSSAAHAHTRPNAHATATRNRNSTQQRHNTPPPR